MCYCKIKMPIAIRQYPWALTLVRNASMHIYAKNLPYTPYFYIIQHIPTKMLYAGCRYSKAKTKYSVNGCHPEEFMKEDGYCTSSKIIKSIISEYSINSFRVVQIIKETELSETVLSYETKFLQLNHIKNNDMWYNMHNNDNKWYDPEYVKSIMLDRYGVENAFSAQEIIEKIHNTNLDRYGVKYPLQNLEVLDKMKETNLEKYGVKYVFQNAEIKNNIAATNLERYGSENVFGSKEIIEKIHNTNLDRYGVKHPLQNLEIMNKTKETNLDRYGVDNPAKNKDVQDKMKVTSLEKYGVDNYGKTEKAKEELSKRSTGAKFYNDGNKNYFVQLDQVPHSSWVKGMKPRNKSI